MSEFTELETRLDVLPQWIDENGHMTVNAFLPAFDQATETFFKYLDIGWTYADQSLFALGMNLDFHHEVLTGDHLSIRSTLLDFDHKRIHLFHQMFQTEAGNLAATNEILMMNVSIATRRSAPFPAVIQDRLRFLSLAQTARDVPPHAFRQLKIRKKQDADN